MALDRNHHRRAWHRGTHFAKVLRDVRELELHLTQDELAAYYGNDVDAPTERTWRGWEQDEHVPTRRHFRWLVRTFELEPTLLREQVKLATRRQAARRRRR
jgi:DNA-binding transcriptional regulator YiaG